MSKYIDVKEVAKLIRKCLKESFGGTKFSVRIDRFSGGSSIDINWTDGPNDAQVSDLVSVFKGSYFDGMIDYKGMRYGSLDGEEVHFGSDYVHTNREYSDKLIEKAMGIVKRKFSIEKELTVEEFRKGAYYNEYPDGWVDVYNSLQSHIHKVAAKITNVAIVEAGETRKRVGFVGDDGYGMGTVGRDGSGENTGLGYPSL